MNPVEGNNRHQNADIHSHQHVKNTEHAEQMREIGKTASGNMAGGNLIVQDYNADGIADADSTGGKPTLSPPKFEPTLISFQATMDQLGSAGAVSAGHTVQALKQQMGDKPIHAVNRQSLPPITNMTQTDTTMTAMLGDKTSFHADFSQKSMQITTDGRQINFQMGENPVATTNGIEIPYSNDELDSLSMMFDILILFHEMGVQSRQISREARNATNESIVQNIKSQAEEQRSAANSQLIAGCVSGTAKMGSAGFSFAGAVRGMKSDATALQQGQAPNAFQGQMISQKHSAIGNLMEGGGEVGASMARFDAAGHEAEQTMLRGGEEHSKHIKQTEQDQMQSSQDLIGKAREALAQMQMQQIQTNQNIARNI